MFIDYILRWARERGHTAAYGSGLQLNELFNSVPFGTSRDGTVVFCRLIENSETVDGRDRATVGIYFARLMEFDFDGEEQLPRQEELKVIGKEFLNGVRSGNVMTYSGVRWQYGYDDYAENLLWVCLRVTLEAAAADCVPLVIPDGEAGGDG